MSFFDICEQTDRQTDRQTRSVQYLARPDIAVFVVKRDVKLRRTNCNTATARLVRGKVLTFWCNGMPYCCNMKPSDGCGSLCGIEDIGYLLLISSAFIDTWFSASANQWWLVVTRRPSKQPLCLQRLSCLQCFDAGLLPVSSFQQAISEQHQSSVGCTEDDKHCSVLYCLSQQRWNPVTRLSITWPVVRHC